VDIILAAFYLSIQVKSANAHLSLSEAGFLFNKRR